MSNPCQTLSRQWRNKKKTCKKLQDNGMMGEVDRKLPIRSWFPVPARRAGRTGPPAEGSWAPSSWHTSSSCFPSRSPSQCQGRYHQWYSSFSGSSYTGCPDDSRSVQKIIFLLWWRGVLQIFHDFVNFYIYFPDILFKKEIILIDTL